MRGGLGRPVGSGIFEAVGGVTCVGVFLAGIVVFTNLSCRFFSDVFGSWVKWSIMSGVLYFSSGKGVESSLGEGG